MADAVYYSPEGNPEMWKKGKQPKDYVTAAAWLKAHPPEVSEADPEAERRGRIMAIKAEMDRLDAEYFKPYTLANLALREEGAIKRKAECDRLKAPLLVELRGLEAAMNG